MEHLKWKKYIFVALATLLHLADETIGLRNVTVSIPKVVSSGGVATLGCRWILDVGETLYSVKWYRSRQEFYRYLPKELPHTRVFTHDGIVVDLNRSSQHQVVLRDLTRNLTGRFQCEVSADAPSFHTDHASSYMHIVDLPESAPVIMADKTLYAAGDTLRANCSSPPADPPAEITWMLNGKLVNGVTSHKETNDININIINTLSKMIKNDLTTVSSHDQIMSGAESNYSLFSTSKPPLQNFMKWKRRSSTSVLEINIMSEYFDRGRIKLACVSSVHTIYSAKAELDIEEERPQIAPVLGTRDIADGLKNYNQPLESNLLFCIIVVLIPIIGR